MSRFVRPSKYRHVFGQPGKKEFGIENVKVSNSAWDTNLVAASAKYLSINWQASGGGAFAILPLPTPFSPLPHALHTKLPDLIPLARGHSAPVLDTAWSPFDDSVVASAGEDGRVLLWKVAESAFEGWGSEHWEPEDFAPVARISGSGRKVGQVLFHPTAAHVLATAAGDHTVRLWDLGNTDDARATLLGHTDTIQALAFNATGTLLVTTCRDRKLRLFDPRAGGEAVRVAEGHAGVKGARVVWMGDGDRFATTGFSRMSDRQVGVWEAGALRNEKMLAVDQSSGVLMPFWSDNSILFLAGKGDGNIRYYEYESGTLHPLAEHTSSQPQRGMTFLPRRALNVTENEIARAYKVVGTGVEPIAFICPRKADAFQADIFPPAPSAEPALSAGEFFTSAKPIARKLVDLDTGSISVAPSVAPSASSTPVKAASYPTPAPAPAPAAAAPARKLTEPAAPPPTVTVAPLSHADAPHPTSASTTQAPPKKIDLPTASPSAAGPLRSPVSPSPTRIEVSRSDSFRILTPKPEPGQVASPDTEDAPEPATRVGVEELTGAAGGDGTAVNAENARLKKDLAQAQAQVRELQIQLDSMREAQRAAKALLLG